MGFTALGTPTKMVAKKDTTANNNKTVTMDEEPGFADTQQGRIANYCHDNKNY